MIKKNLFVLLMSLFSFGGIALAEDAVPEELHVYLCFGQSNMEGNAKIEDQDRTGVDPRFMVLQAVDCSDLGRVKGKWYTAVPPLVRCNTGLTPADYFGRKLVARLPEHIKVGVINVAVGGCSIQLFDNDECEEYLSTAADWLKNFASNYNNRPYDRLVEMGKIAQSNGGVIKGILLHQGETNSGDQTWPSKVKKIYDRLLTDLNLEENSVPLLAGEMVNKDQNGACWGMNSVIYTLPDVIPNAYVIPSEGCEGVSDRLHFSAQGYRDLGVRYANQMLSILGYDIEGDESDLIETLSSELENKEMLPGSIQDMNVKATYKNGNIAPVGSLVSAVSSNPDVAYYSRGKIVAKSGGDATITVTYKDFSGTEKTTSQDVTVKSFFAFDLINPSIWTDGTFDQQTQTLVTGQWGAGGWWYDNAIDISDFKYLIVDLSKTQTCGTEFRLFDENSYWTQPASYVFGTSKRVIVDLQSMTKTVDGVKKKCDPSHIYGVCFWSHGGGDIALQDIYLTNSDNYEKPMSVNSVKLNQRDVVDVYNLNGILLYSNLKRKNILKTLPSGIYIIDNEKILIP